MEKVTNKKLKIDQEGEQSSEEGGMEQLVSHAARRAVENINSAVDFVGLGVFPEEVSYLLQFNLYFS